MKTNYPRKTTPSENAQFSLQHGVLRFGPGSKSAAPAPSVAQPEAYLGSVTPLNEMGAEALQQLALMLAQSMAAHMQGVRSYSSAPTLRSAVNGLKQR